MRFVIIRGKGSRDKLVLLSSTSKEAKNQNPRKQAELLYQWMFRNLHGKVLEERTIVLKRESLGE
jgi:site-specific recombinase XerD